jgi:hypothetical protein
MMTGKIIFTLLTVIAFSPLFSKESKGGSFFYEEIRTLSFADRERAIEFEALSGNIPGFIKKYVPITTSGKDALGRDRKVTIFVSPDYLSIGSDDDYFIVPMGPLTAQRIADFMNSSLPTPKVVDIIYSHSRLKLEPFTFIPRGNRNETPDILYDHSKIIQAQMKAAAKPPGTFVAGTKKDIVICGKLTDPRRTRHVTIYGWHRLDGKPIQPANNVHINTYVDYSHGVRLVSNRVIIDGEVYNYRQILGDPVLHTLLSYDNEPLEVTAYSGEYPID